MYVLFCPSSHDAVIPYKICVVSVVSAGKKAFQKKIKESARNPLPTSKERKHN
jgi:hypothetical protein